MAGFLKNIGDIVGSRGLIGRTVRAALFPKDPPYVIHFVTHRCNASCCFCFDSKERAAADAGAELTPIEVGKSARNWRGLLQVTLTGGEPFLRDDLVEVADAWLSGGAMGLTIDTNGSMPDRVGEVARTILAERPGLNFDLNISIDGPPEVHDRIRGVPGLYEKAMAAANALSPLQGHHPGFRLGATLTFSAANQGVAYNTLEELADSGVFRRIQVVLARGDTKDPAMKDFDISEFSRCSSFLSSVSLVPGGLGIKETLSGLVRKNAEMEASGEAGPGECLAGRTMVMVDPYGGVYPCEMLPQTRPEGVSEKDIYDWKMGALREHDYSVRQLLASPHARSIKEWIVASGCHCGFECAAYNNIVFRPAKWPGLAGKILWK